MYGGIILTVFVVCAPLWLPLSGKFTQIWIFIHFFSAELLVQCRTDKRTRNTANNAACIFQPSFQITTLLPCALHVACCPL